MPPRHLNDDEDEDITLGVIGGDKNNDNGVLSADNEDVMYYGESRHNSRSLRDNVFLNSIPSQRKLSHFQFLQS